MKTKAEVIEECIRIFERPMHEDGIPLPTHVRALLSALPEKVREAHLNYLEDFDDEEDEDLARLEFVQALKDWQDLVDPNEPRPPCFTLYTKQVFVYDPEDAGNAGLPLFEWSTHEPDVVLLDLTSEDYYTIDFLEDMILDIRRRQKELKQAEST